MEETKKYSILIQYKKMKQLFGFLLIFAGLVGLSYFSWRSGKNSGIRECENRPDIWKAGDTAFIENDSFGKRIRITINSSEGNNVNVKQ